MNARIAELEETIAAGKDLLRNLASWGDNADEEEVRTVELEVGAATMELMALLKPEPTKIEQVLELVEYGFAVHPVCANSKAPALYGWPVKRLTADELKAHFEANPDHNVGMVCGAETGWVVVDLDGEHNVAAGLNNLPPTPLMAWTGSGDGLHLFYRMPTSDALPKQKLYLPWVGPGRTARGSGADLFGTGSQVVLPPSVHPSGKIYEWVDGLVPAETVPFFKPEWLEVK